MNAARGIVFDIFRGTTHDGPGIRTTVFLKGCPLKCEWCHNPEGIKAGPEIWWEANKCIGCLICKKTCHNNALVSDESGIHTDLAKCKLCGACVRACPSLALAFADREWTVEHLAEEVLKDNEYFKSFGGGVTVSGGEPLGQYEFVSAFFSVMKEKGIHTALDTSGAASEKAFDKVLPFTDCVLYDIKIFDAALHRKFTGQSNKLILDNLIYVSNYIRNVKGNMKLWIRTPLIPGATASEENISAIGHFIQDNISDVVERWELCAFNNVCKSKYKKIRQPWPYEKADLMDQCFIDKLESIALAAGMSAKQLVFSGLIRKDNLNEEIEK